MSLIQTHKVYLLMILASVSIALAQFCFKVGAIGLETKPNLSPLLNLPLWLGVLIYIISFPLTLYTYKLAALSKAFPILSLSLLWSASLAVLFLGETITLYRLLGGCLIIFGTMLIGGELNE